MRYSWCSVLLIMSLVILSTALVFAQNGKITGSVKDASSGEAIIGANVVLEGTTLGGAADVNGVYYILNVPPGNYNLVASAVGYAR
ncbi:MAG: carboxypeptidase-like regulatory domain-containing protein, partial [Bacteroidota bacterium]